MPDDDIAHFQSKYGENYLYLLEVDPTHIHAFWEIIPDKIPDKILKQSMQNPDLCLKIYYDFKNKDHLCVDLRVQGLINDWFIEIERPLEKCYAELGYNDPGKGVFVSICRSNDLDISIEQELPANSIRRKKVDIPSSHATKRDNSNPFFTDKKKGEKSHHIEHITDKDIKDFYRNLSEKRISNSGFSPWKLILEKMYSAEILRKLWLSELMNLYIQNFSSSENHSSYWSSVSSYSSIFKIEQDK